MLFYVIKFISGHTSNNMMICSLKIGVIWIYVGAAAADHHRNKTKLQLTRQSLCSRMFSVYQNHTTAILSGIRFVVLI